MKSRFRGAERDFGAIRTGRAFYLVAWAVSEAPDIFFFL